MKINGILEAFFETGTEGIIWSLYDNQNKGYQSLHGLNNGDYLTVYDKNDNIYWEGEISLEYKTNYRSYPSNPEYGQQEVLGYWIHGLQENLNPEFWAKMFLTAMKAELKKKGE